MKSYIQFCHRNHKCIVHVCVCYAYYNMTIITTAITMTSRTTSITMGITTAAKGKGVGNSIGKMNSYNNTCTQIPNIRVHVYILYMNAL